MSDLDAEPTTHVPTELPMDLWRRYRRSGDRRIRERLVVIFAPLVHHIVRDGASALPDCCDLEDLVSGGLEALIHAIDEYDPGRGRTLEQYAWVRVQRGVHDELDRYRAEPAQGAPSAEGVDPGGDPERASVCAEARTRFHDAFHQLPERDRRVTVMRHVDGLTLREIGELLGVTTSRVCQIDTHACRELRVTLADDEALLGGVA
jgi:RNA polymerase sigma factor (sigma-70 family)